MGLSAFLVIVILAALSPSSISQVQDFVSIDCGGTAGNYTDPSTGLEWTPDSGLMAFGRSTAALNSTDSPRVYQTRRDFPVDDQKYCYTLRTEERRRYLVRATFRYGDLGTEETFPKFQLYLDTTKWTTVAVYDAGRVYVEEMIIRASSGSVDVCLCCATTGVPFISSLELRPLNLSIYATNFEDSFFLEVAARVNFGALTADAIRYPDDPYDRIWESDLAKRQNFLVGVAPGTERINTSRDINVRTRECPPVKVMQTAVVGTEGTLSYRLNLEDFPANARAYAYFAEIEDLDANETRKFRLIEPQLPEYNNAVVNIIENANGSYTLYEPSYMNVSLDFVLSFAFRKTSDSIRGPLLNAMEISRYVEVAPKTSNQDVTAVEAIRMMSAGTVLTDQGDPCLPVSWEWVSCGSTTPPRVIKISLSGKDLKGSIPSVLNDMDQLTELWLDGNMLSGYFPDLSNLRALRILHVENNNLTGPLPSYLGVLPSLLELHVENNTFSGDIPADLLSGKIKFMYGGNSGLHKRSDRRRIWLIVGASVGILAVLALLSVGVMFFLPCRRKKSFLQSFKKGDSTRTSSKPSAAYSIPRGNHLREDGLSHYIALADLEVATERFAKKIGRGSFGSVFYGRMKDGKEVAVKIMDDSSSNGHQQFATEVALLSRIHHRNLVPLIGFCEEEHQRILVYEFMHNGTLRDHLHDPVKQKQLSWLTRLKIAEDSAKGLEYLHTGCNPTIIHRDVKTSNILLDVNMRAKVSDFGLSRQADEDLTHISSVARGTVGYLDPEYYGNQQLTEKSDVYSFGVVLLELISGRKPVSAEDYGADYNIVHWARALIRRGDVVSVVDPALGGTYKLESIWRVAEVALQCVEQYSSSRPRMQEIIVAVQDAIKIENASEENRAVSPGSSKAHSARKTLLTSFLEVESPDLSNDCYIPSAR
ncbi:hypothetical protein MLD38_017015 [Melastoma candidum]|uniref:Uncharacterized protein n=1 Tax=Melastoma candidum TaxID=119954 RepID=A0ACB9QPF4_9MYRT|nr:hypothetical protein MLD38_017015 [Melastoma candidum]